MAREKADDESSTTGVRLCKVNDTRLVLASRFATEMPDRLLRLAGAKYVILVLSAFLSLPPPRALSA